MYINERFIIEEDKEDSFADRLEKKIKDFLNNDTRFSKYNFEVDVYYDWECYNNKTNCMWHSLNIVIRNLSLTQTNKIYGEVVPTTVFEFTTDGYEPQLVCVNGEFKFFHVFSFGSSSLTNPVTFQNNCDDGRFENIIEEEVFNKNK